MSSTDMSLLQTDHITCYGTLTRVWHCGFLVIVLSTELRPWWPAGEPSAVPANREQPRLATPLKVLEDFRWQVVSVPVLFSLLLNQRLEKRKKDYGIEDRQSSSLEPPLTM